MQSQCPSPEELSGFALGTLAEDSADVISNHLEQCPACEETIQNLEETVDSVVKKLRQPDATDPFTLESGCERVVALVEAIGRDPSFRTVGTQTIPADESAELGTIRSYRLLAKLGQGGMGSVYKALHVDLDKVVALKVLPQDRLTDEAAIARFRREMKAVGKLSHPNIVQATDAGEEDGMHYLVMELVDGIDLSKFVRQNGPLPVADACELIRQAAEGLEHASEHGLVHRDIKPSNLMLTRDGSVKILDLGLALLAGPQATDTSELTATGQVMGTIDYMAPEQGSDTHSVDNRADAYSLGATLYKLLTGRAPFEGPRYNSPIKKLNALANTDPERVDTIRNSIPRELADLVQQMLSKSPEDRPSTPIEVARLLEPFARSADLDQTMQSATNIEPLAPVQESQTTNATFIAETNVAQPERASDSKSPGGTPRSEADGRGERDGKSSHALPDVRACHPENGPAARTGKRPALRTLAGIAALLLLSVIVFKFTTRDGTLFVELDSEQPVQRVEVDGNEVHFDLAGSAKRYKFDVDPGERTIRMFLEDGTEIITEATETPIEIAAGGDYTIRGWLELEEPRPQGSGLRADAINHAIHFDGVDDFVLLKDLTYDGSHPITIEYWTTPEELTLANVGIAVFHPALHARLHPGTGPSECRWAVATTVEVRDDDGIVVRGITGNGSVPGEFVHRSTHVATTYDGSRIRLYIDGHLEDEVDATGLTLRPANRFHIGKAYTDPPAGCFHGRIDEVRISNTARYTEDFTPAERFDPDEHTLALYHFDEADGDVLIDSSGNEHHGEIHGATWVRQVGPETWVPYDQELRIAEAGSASVADFILELTPGDPIELLPYVDVARDTGRGAWTLTDGVLRSSGSGLEKLSVPITVNGSYELRVAFTRNDGDDAVVIQFPAGIGSATFSLDSWKGVEGTLEGIGGISDVDGWQSYHLSNPTARPGELENGRRYSVVLNVELNEGRVRATVSLDGQPYTAFEGSQTSLTPTSGWEATNDRSIGVGSFASPVTFDSAELRLLSGTARLVRGYHDRAIAERVLQLGGVAISTVGNDYRVFRDPDELPSERFPLTGIGLDDRIEFDSFDLTQLAALPRLDNFSAKNPSFGDDQLELLAEIGTLKALLLNGASVTDAGMRHLRNLSQLRNLYLQNTGITGSGLRELANLTELRTLFIAAEGVTDEGIQFISGLPRLGVVSLEFATVTDAAIDDLVKLQGLRDLNILSTGITAEGAARLQQELPDCRIRHESISDYGAPNFALQFDGEDDYVEIPMDGVRLGDEFTVEMHVDAEPVLLPDDGTRIQTWLAQWTAADRLEFGWTATREETWFRASYRTADGFSHFNWDDPVPGRHHFAAVQRDGRTQLFVNGRLLGSGGSAATNVIPEPLDPTMFLGRKVTQDNHLQRFYSGTIDEVRISNTARYTEDFTPEERFTPDEHTIALYHFDEADGDVLIDSSGNDHHGQILGARWMRVENYAAERRLAQWVLNQGGWVKADVGDTPGVTISTIEDLPERETSFLVSVVNLSGLESVNDQDVQTLRSLCPRDSLYHLNLGGTGITDAALDALTGMEIVQLVLFETAITDGIAEKLTLIQGLSALRLDGTAISDAACPTLASLWEMQQLVLSSTNVTDDGAALLAALPELTELQLIGNRNIGDETLLWASKHPRLQIVRLGATQVTDAGLVFLVDSNLKWIEIDDCREITDLGLEALSQVESLETLNLSSLKSISDDGLAHIARLPNVTSLDLHGTPITDECLTTLERFTSLSLLRIYQTEVSPEGIQRLHEALPQCEIIWDGGILGAADYQAERRLAEWVLSHEGMVTLVDESRRRSEITAEADLPAEPFQVVRFLIDHQDLSDPAHAVELSQLMSEVGPIDGIDLYFSRLSSALLEALTGGSGIDSLWLTGCKGIGREGFAALQRVNGLREIDVRGSECDDTGVAALAQIGTLESLIYELPDGGVALRHFESHPALLRVDHRSPLSVQGIENLMRIPHLQILALWGFEGDRGPCVEALSRLRDLENLQWYVEGLSQTELTAICRLTGLRSLAFGGGSRNRGMLEVDAWSPLASLEQLENLTLSTMDDQRLTAIGNLTSLVKLSLPGTSITDAGLAHVASLANLVELKLNETAINGDGLQHLAGLDDLHNLLLNDTEVNDDAVPHLLQFKSLNRLELSGTDITADGIARLRAGLPDTLIIHNQDIAGVDPTDRALAQWVLEQGGWIRANVGDARGVTIASIDDLPAPSASFHVDLVSLSGLDSITDEDVRTLRALLSGDSLYHLELAGTGITDAALDALAGLEISQLTLDQTAITDAVVDRLATIGGLRSLYLSNTSISDAACPGLASLEGLGFITLSRTQVSDEGAAHLAALPNLGEFQIGGNPGIGDATMSWVADHPSLRVLLISKTAISNAGLEHLVDSGLIRLEIHGCENLADGALETLSRVESLEHLNLQGMESASDEAVAHLTQLPNLKILHIDSTPVTDECLESLAQMTHLTHLNVLNTQITRQGTQRLHEALPQCEIVWDGGTPVPEDSEAIDPQD